jgi:hypothetical protein
MVVEGEPTKYHKEQVKQGVTLIHGSGIDVDGGKQRLMTQGEKIYNSSIWRGGKEND